MSGADPEGGGERLTELSNRGTWGWEEGPQVLLEKRLLSYDEARESLGLDDPGLARFKTCQEASR